MSNHLPFAVLLFLYPSTFLLLCCYFYSKPRSFCSVTISVANHVPFAVLLFLYQITFLLLCYYFYIKLHSFCCVTISISNHVSFVVLLLLYQTTFLAVLLFLYQTTFLLLCYYFYMKPLSWRKLILYWNVSAFPFSLRLNTIILSLYIILFMLYRIIAVMSVLTTKDFLSTRLNCVTLKRNYKHSKYGKYVDLHLS